VALVDESRVEGSGSDGLKGRTTPNKRRRQMRVLRTAFVVLFALTVSFFVWAADYQPLSLGPSSLVWPQRPAPPSGHALTASARKAWQSRAQFVVYQPRIGDRFGFVYSITNNGPFGVTLLGVDKSTLDLRGTALYTIDAGTTTDTGSTDPRPASFVWSTAGFALQPGQDFEGVGATWTYNGCPAGTREYHNGSSLALPSFGVRYSFLGFTHTVMIQMQRPISVGNEPQCASATK